MDAALTNLASVKELDRTNEGRNRVVPTGRTVDPMSMIDQVFAAVIAGSSMTYANALTSFGNWGPAAHALSGRMRTSTYATS